MLSALIPLFVAVGTISPVIAKSYAVVALDVAEASIYSLHSASDPAIPPEVMFRRERLHRRLLSFVKYRLDRSPVFLDGLFGYFRNLATRLIVECLPTADPWDPPVVYSC